MSDELPEGWSSTHVSEVIEDFQPGFASGEKNVKGGVPHLRMNNIGLDGKLVLDLVRTVPENLAKPRHDLSPGDVLVCTTNSVVLVGKCAYFDLEGRYAFSNHLTRLRPKRDVVDGRFLRWNLWLHWKRGVFDDKCKHWVNQSTLPKDALLEDEIVVPPLAEQRRIVAKLEKLLGQVDACQQRLANLPTLLKRFRQSVLAAACSGRLTTDWREERTTDCTDDTDKKTSAKSAKSAVDESFGEDLEKAEELPELPVGWRWVRFGSVIGELRNGVPLRPNMNPPGVPILRISATRPGKVDLGDVRYMPNGKDFLPFYALRDGDLLFTRYNGSIELLGVCGMVRGLGKGTRLYPDKLMRVRFDHNCILPAFAEVFFSAPEVHERVVAKSKSSAGQNGVSGSDIKTQPFALPPLAEQQEIVRRVEGLFALADQLEMRLAQARGQVAKLTPSLLARAFAGQLVPQDPNDEPASVLLNRIGAQREMETRDA